MDSMQSSCLLSSFRNAFVYSSLVILLTTVAVSTSSDENATDYLALVSFKLMIRQDPYGALISWNTSIHFCNWKGVSCGKRHRKVTVLNMMWQGLIGSLSPYVGNLSFLSELSISGNSFQGSIPPELGRLSRLRVLELSHNRFEGVIPTNLSSCSNLKKLWLGSNQLVGSIHKEISFLSKLTHFSVHQNKLIGGIPPFIGNITSLVQLRVHENPLGGSIPDTLGNLKNLRVLLAGDCSLYGTVPYSIYNLSSLSNFSFPDNQLTGSLPLAIGAMLPHLVHLHLSNNQLTGHLPPSISNCSKLRILEIGENNLSGKVTVDFSKLEDIHEIFLNDNLYGSREEDDLKFINHLKNCSRLYILTLYNNKLQGVLPSSIGNLSDQLIFLSIASNRLHGNVPLSIGNLVGLEDLRLGTNRFTGAIPSTIDKLSKLKCLDLCENQFSSRIPYAIGNLTMIIYLYLGFNILEGYIPSNLGNFHHLLELNLNDNKLGGEIPKQLLQLSSLSITLDLSRNSLFGSLPNEVGDLKMLSNLDLSYNNLSGNIPSSLGACTSLSSLSLKGNLFQGMIPPSLSSLRGLVKLDVSQNNLSGKIPIFLQRISLEYMNLSYNDFEGEVPVEGVFANVSSFSIFGNHRLCGGLVEIGLPKCKEAKKHNRVPALLIVILIASTLLTVLCFAYVWCTKKRKVLPSQSLTNGRFLKVSYNQLFKATDGFSEANLIGKGGFSSIYKGTLDDDNDRFVAVKVLRLQIRGAHKSFLAECEAWRSIRHRNLLKIVTSCSSVDFQGNDFKALVYEFMPNGSLHDWLHSSASNSTLNLIQRINILIDVASALDYLHNRCLTTILHCDLKPSNILLDDDMVAHVGDFGLSRFLGIELNQSSSTRINGTIGYAPPEYGLGNEMTSSGDVYSFGILLLEVMTGKKPTDDIFNEGLSLHIFASTALPDHVTNVIDRNAIVMQNTEANAKKMEECLASTVKIGVSCSMDSPLDRMNIEDVVHELQHILDVLQNI